MKFKTKEELAKYSIGFFLENQKIPVVSKSDVNKNLHKKAGCFVTVYVDKKLRGCIGNAVGYQPLYLSIINNAISAGFEDNRFLSIQKNELAKLKVEVSILTPLKIYRPKNSQELISFLEKEKPGLVLEKYGQKALFLPQVWKELPDPKDFLANLCFKAGLNPDDWKENTSFMIFNNQKD